MNLRSISASKCAQNIRHDRIRSPTRCYILPPILAKKIIEETQSKDLKRNLTRAIEFSARARTERKFKSGLLSRLLIEPIAPGATPQKNRFLYDAQHRTQLPGVLKRSEGQNPTGDSDADKAYDNSGHTWDFYYEMFQRVSIDDHNLPLKSVVHYDRDLDNAMWDGTYMEYGDGGGGFIKAGTLTNLDVCGHELTHGVTENESNLEYHDEMGGLNEGFSDIFGAMINQWVNKWNVDKEDGWLIGGGIIEPSAFPNDPPSKVRALRDMANPGTAFPGDAQIGSYDHFDPGMDPHYSSGIPNKAFYLTCKEIGGYSWEKAGKIWYYTLANDVKQYSKFIDVANSTYAAAGSLFKDDPSIQKAVEKGWKGVGITPKATTITQAFRLNPRFRRG